MSATSGRLKVRLRLPTSEKDSDPVRCWSDIRDMATVAEDVGFDSLWIVDHFIYQMEGAAKPDGLWEAWSMVAALAACTNKVEIGTLVLCMGFFVLYFSELVPNHEFGILATIILIIALLGSLFLLPVLLNLFYKDKLNQNG